MVSLSAKYPLFQDYILLQFTTCFDCLNQTILGTVAMPLQAAATIQKLYF